jgi:hypothetical protein
MTDNVCYMLSFWSTDDLSSALDSIQNIYRAAKEILTHDWNIIGTEVIPALICRTFLRDVRRTSSFRTELSFPNAKKGLTPFVGLAIISFRRHQFSQCVSGYQISILARYNRNSSPIFQCSLYMPAASTSAHAHEEQQQPRLQSNG